MSESFESFARKLEIACRKLETKNLQAEKERVHKDAMRDTAHAFRNVDIPEISHKDRTHLTI